MESTLKEFLDMLYNQGITVQSLTLDKVVWATSKNISSNHYKGNILPTKDFEYKIYDSFSCEGLHNIKTIVLADMIDQEKRIHCIKIVRAILGLSLREAKDIVFDNWDAWRAQPECRKIDQTPQKDLPLLIGSLKFDYSEKYLAKKIRGVK